MEANVSPPLSQAFQDLKMQLPIPKVQFFCGLSLSSKRSYDSHCISSYLVSSQRSLGLAQCKTLEPQVSPQDVKLTTFSPSSSPGRQVLP